MKVSVIIPTYNSAEFVLRCLKSVVNQSYGNIEVIVVDDGSVDSTVQLIHETYGKNIKVLLNSTNQGPAFCRTRGLFECNGEYVAFLDSDDYWEKEFVSATVCFLEEHSEAVAVSTGYVGINLSGAPIQKPNLNEEDKKNYKKSGSICPSFFEFWTHYFGILTGSVMMRTEAAKTTGGQRKELRLTEDLEFWGYLSTFGKWGFIPKPLFITDPGVLDPAERLKKMQKRYYFFTGLDINDWTKRIESRISPNEMEPFVRILNHIKTTIVIANAYTFKIKESYKLVGLWKDELEPGLGGVLRKCHGMGPFIWPLVCLALKIRELLKSYLSHFMRTLKH